jgi:peroxiredoxin
MSLLIRNIRIPAGWLAIPASLLFFAGCTTSETVPPPPPHHEAVTAHGDGSPFEKVFNGEAEFIVLTFYDLYCVACQQSAENFSALHLELEQRFPDNVIQMTGVGIGDTEFELKVFQRRYALPYASIADPDKTFEEPFSIRGTPTVLVFHRDNSECIEVYRNEGRFRSSDSEKLLESIRQSVSSE